MAHERVRFALVGCSGIALKHGEALKSLKSTELAAVCDLRPERTEAVGARGNFPVTESLAERILSLPMYPELTDQQVERVVRTSGLLQPVQA